MKYIKWCIYLVSVLVVSVALLEFAAKTLAPDVYFVFSDVDHRNKPFQTAEFNDDGLRDPRLSTSVNPEHYNIIVLGDSFVYGLLLESSLQAIPAQLESNLKAHFARDDINVYNFGWVSSSPLLQKRQLKEIGHKYKPDLIILCVDMTDIYDDLIYTQRLNHDGFWRLSGIAPTTIGLLWHFVVNTKYGRYVYDKVADDPIPYYRYFSTLKPLDETREYFSEIENNIRGIAQYSHQELGVKFVTFILPRGFQFSDKESPKDMFKSEKWPRQTYVNLGPYSLEPFRFFEEMSSRVDFPMISLLSDFKDPGLFPVSFAHDAHYNANGSKKAADFIAEHCYEIGCFKGLTNKAQQ